MISKGTEKWGKLLLLIFHVCSESETGFCERCHIFWPQLRSTWRGVIKSCTFLSYPCLLFRWSFILFLFGNITNDKLTVISIFCRASLYPKEVFLVFYSGTEKQPRVFLCVLIEPVHLYFSFNNAIVLPTVHGC